MEYPNWFKQIAQYNFEEFLLPESGKPNLRYLQLGVFTGDASVWLLENVLTHDTSRLTDVDTWKGAANEPIQEQMDFEDVYSTYLNKIKDYKVRIERFTTADFLLSQYGCDRPLGEYFDFIYVDADHTTVGVLLDAELSWPLLKSGGIMAFDDYTWHHHTGDPRLEPKVGIDLFLHRHTGEYDVLAVNDQVWIRKH